MSQAQFLSSKMWIVGTDGDDFFAAGEGNETIAGGAGDDFFLSVLGGRSVLFGGAGDDRFVFDSSTRLVGGGAGVDAYNYTPQAGDHGTTTVYFEEGVDYFDPLGLPDTTRVTVTEESIVFIDRERDIHYRLKLVDPNDGWVF